MWLGLLVVALVIGVATIGWVLYRSVDAAPTADPALDVIPRPSDLPELPEPPHLPAYEPPTLPTPSPPLAPQG